MKKMHYNVYKMQYTRKMSNDSIFPENSEKTS